MSDVPGSNAKIQIEALTSRGPGSESSVQSMAAAINFLLSNQFPIGSIVESMLTESAYQIETSSNWILADGRAVIGSRYQELSGFDHVPDLRSVYTRGKDNGRGLNPDGDLALGTYQGDQFGSHTHQYVDTRQGGSNSFDGGDSRGVDNSPTLDTSSSGGNETRPKSVTVNKFIRIN